MLVTYHYSKKNHCHNYFVFLKNWISQKQNGILAFVLGLVSFATNKKFLNSSLFTLNTSLMKAMLRCRSNQLTWLPYSRKIYPFSSHSSLLTTDNYVNSPSPIPAFSFINSPLTTQNSVILTCWCNYVCSHWI